MTPEQELNQAPALPEVPADAIQPAKPRGIAPVWHTLVLVAAIGLLSLSGSARIEGYARAPRHLRMYGATIVMQLLMLGWVALGLRLRKVPFRSLFGMARKGWKALLIDIGIALAFWWCSLIILGVLNLAWLTADAAIHHRPLPIQTGKTHTMDPAQQETVRRVAVLAPSDGTEVAGWILLCIVVGFVEETVFRGYLQTQFTRWTHGKAAFGVVFSAIVFGAAHGYEGVRSMSLLAAYGVFFSLLALFRRSLRSCMIAHGWHDLFTGLTLMLLRSLHVV